MNAKIVDFPLRPRSPQAKDVGQSMRAILEAARRPPVPGEHSNMAMLRWILAQAVPRKPRGGPPEPEPPENGAA